MFLLANIFGIKFGKMSAVVSFSQPLRLDLSRNFVFYKSFEIVLHKYHPNRAKFRKICMGQYGGNPSNAIFHGLVIVVFGHENHADGTKLEGAVAHILFFGFDVVKKSLGAYLLILVLGLFVFQVDAAQMTQVRTRIVMAAAIAAINFETDVIPGIVDILTGGHAVFAGDVTLTLIALPHRQADFFSWDTWAKRAFSCDWQNTRQN